MTYSAKVFNISSHFHYIFISNDPFPYSPTAGPPTPGNALGCHGATPRFPDVRFPPPFNMASGK